MTMITPSYLGETIEYSSLHACRSTLEDPTSTPSRPLTAIHATISTDADANPYWNATPALIGYEPLERRGEFRRAGRPSLA